MIWGNERRVEGEKEKERIEKKTGADKISAPDLRWCFFFFFLSSLSLSVGGVEAVEMVQRKLLRPFELSSSRH